VTGGKSAVPRDLLFLLSPRLVDFDTWLPVAYGLRSARPELRVRFVAFDRAAVHSIADTPMFAAALSEAGISLSCLDASGAGGQLGRLLRRLGGVLRLAAWILRAPRPVLILGRPYRGPVYRTLRRLSRWRGGRTLVMLKTRSPDRIFTLHWSRRAENNDDTVPVPGEGGRDADGIVFFHDDQTGLIADLARYGRVIELPRYRLGLPHRFAAWRQFIARKESDMKGALGAGRGPVYAILAGKGMTTTLRDPQSVHLALRCLLEALARLRPGATVLIRPHPFEAEYPYVAEAIAETPGLAIEVSAMHTELLLVLADRIFFNSPTNLLFAGFDGRFVDCSDYPPEELAATGPRSRGYGAVHLPPAAPDFDSRLAAILDDDSAFTGPEADGGRQRMIAAGDPDADALLAWLDGVPAAPM
jgi:hypothetical protein